MSVKELTILEDSNEISHAISNIILDTAEKAIENKGFFTLAVSGGSLAQILCSILLGKSPKIDWDKWRIFLADERFVPLTDPDSTYQVYKNNLFDPAGVPKDSTYPIELNLSLNQSAQSYQNAVSSLYPNSPACFDLIILGMGPDGHTCSLFPNHASLSSQSLVVPIFDSPKKPAKRISFTLKMLNQAHLIIFVVCGAEKSPAIQRIFKDDEDPSLPSSLVKGRSVLWFIDKAAASDLVED